MILLLLGTMRSSALDDLFKVGTDLSNLGILALLSVIVVALGYIAYQSYRREVARSERFLAGWEAATAQFERALDLIDKMQAHWRAEDAR